MSDHQLVINGQAGRQLDFVIERLRDGAFYHPASDSWRKFHGQAVYVRMAETAKGHYELGFPELDPEQDYCVQVIDIHCPAAGDRSDDRRQGQQGQNPANWDEERPRLDN